jgi:hypothetical protein
VKEVQSFGCKKLKVNWKRPDRARVNRNIESRQNKERANRVLAGTWKGSSNAFSCIFWIMFVWWIARFRKM